MARSSYGLLMYRRPAGGGLEVFLAHPGGPYYARKDEGAWTIPKGEPLPDEDPLSCAKREFEEEIGIAAGGGPFLALGEIKQRGGKLVQAWAFEGAWDDRQLRSSHFELEWPPRSGRKQSFPEVDRAAFFGVEAARAKLNPAQVALLDRLLQQLG